MLESGFLEDFFAWAMSTSLAWVEKKRFQSTGNQMWASADEKTNSRLKQSWAG